MSSCHHVCHHLPRQTPEFISSAMESLSSRPPGSYDHGGIGGPDRLGFMWFCPLGRWKDLSLKSSAYPKDINIEPQRTCWASLKHWLLPLPVFDKSRMSKTCHTPHNWRMGEGDLQHQTSFGILLFLQKCLDVCAWRCGMKNVYNFQCMTNNPARVYTWFI